MYHVVTHTDDAQAPSSDGTKARSQGAPSVDPEGPEAKESRKERVLHTRVPAALERELKRFAEALRIPVSNLVRTILEDALEVAGAATRLPPRDPLEAVVAFQEVTLAAGAACARCSADLVVGSRARLGIHDVPNGPRVFVCVLCDPTC